MPRDHRRLTHELAHLYFVGTVATGVEPRRFIKLCRTERSAWPDCTLAEAARRAEESTAATSDPRAGRQAASTHQATTYTARLFEVQCDEKMVTSLLGARGGDVASVAWQPERKRDRIHARERNELEAKVVFTSLAAAQRAQRTVGGGLRGRFRCEWPTALAATPTVATTATGSSTEMRARSRSL